MKKSIKPIIAGLLFVPMLAFGTMLFTASTALATPCTGLTPVLLDSGKCGTQSDRDAEIKTACDKGKGVLEGLKCVNPGGPQTIFGDGGIFTTVVNIALFIIGAISVIMLIFGGIRYTLSGGDAKAVEAAKNTILYAIIGVVIAVLAWAIVNFLLTSLLGS